MISFTFNSDKSAWNKTGNDPKGVSNLQNITSNITGSVRLSEGKVPNIPEIGLTDGTSRWLPICGPNFSNNNYGASLFCQKLDSKYTHGIISKKNVRETGPGLFIGKCGKDDKDLFACSGGPFSDLPGWKACFLSNFGTVEVKCFEGMEHQNGTSTTEMTTTNTTSKVMGKFFNLYLTFYIIQSLWFPLL